MLLKFSSPDCSGHCRTIPICGGDSHLLRMEMYRSSQPIARLNTVSLQYQTKTIRSTGWHLRLLHISMKFYSFEYLFVQTNAKNIIRQKWSKWQSTLKVQQCDTTFSREKEYMTNKKHMSILCRIILLHFLFLLSYAFLNKRACHRTPQTVFQFTRNTSYSLHINL